MINAKSLTVIGLFGLLATTISDAAAAPYGTGAAAVQRAAPSDVVLAQDRTLRQRRVRAPRNIGQTNALADVPGPVVPYAAIDLYQQGDRCRVIYPCNMSNNLD